MTAPLGAVPAKIASSPTAKMAMNHTNPLAFAGGNQNAATMVRNPITALHPARTYSTTQLKSIIEAQAPQHCTWP